MRLVGVLVALCWAGPLWSAVEASVGVKSVKVKGELRCGNQTVKAAKVALYRVPGVTKKLNELEEMEVREISPEGRFDFGANTNGRPVNETDLDPAVRIFHRCDVLDGKKTNQTRSFQLKVPKEFVTAGKTAKKTYDIGTLNLELEYPGEGFVKDAKKT